MKKDQYFSLEVNFLNDSDVLWMMAEMYSAEALGIYVMFLFHLRVQDNYEASCQPMYMSALAHRHQVPLERLMHVFNDFNLFEVDEEREMFRSPYLDRVMKKLEDRWEQNRINGQKGGRPPKRAKTSETPASKVEKPNETQEKKEEEKRSITTVNNSSNTAMPVVASVAVAAPASVVPAAAASPVAASSVAPEPVVPPVVTSPPVMMKVRSIDEEGQRPLQPVHPWEKLVRQLSTSREYMELIGMHSGLGQLFVDHQERIIELFADHIRLYDKGGQLLFYEDVKRYFANYIAANSITCHSVRETLLAEIRQKDKGNVYCYETRIDGKRTYFGCIIPSDAPPRPDAAAVWDGVRMRWAH